MIERLLWRAHIRRWRNCDRLLEEGRKVGLYPRVPSGHRRGETPADFADRVTFHQQAEDAVARLAARRAARG